MSGAGHLTRPLGWLSVGLGAAQFVVPDALTRLVGARPTTGSRRLMRSLGLRELAAGAGIFSRPEPSGFLWGRVAGDAMDLALLGNALTAPSQSHKGRAAMVTAAVAGVTVLDIVAASRTTRTKGASMDAQTTITINATPEVVYGYWRDFERLPSFMYHLESVQAVGNGRSHWVAKAPAGRTVEWDAEVTDDVAGERIAWQSVGGASVPNSGSVRFATAPAGQGTEVRVEVEYSLPGGALGSVVAKLFGEEPNQQISDDLRRLKQIVETGEIARSEGSPLGVRTRNAASQHDGQPLDDDEVIDLQAQEVRA